MQDHPEVSQDSLGDLNVRGLWQTCLRLAVRAAHDPRFPLQSRFHNELARAELDGRLPEFYALGIQGIFAMPEASEVAEDYFGMAELVVASPIERAVVARWRNIYEAFKIEQRRSASQRQLSDSSVERIDDEELAAFENDLLAMLRRAGVLDAQASRDGGRFRAA
jgi:hypothetical protein